VTGLGGQRVYLDWNATAPLRPEARAAMLQAMDAVGNPSSVHAEGRAARALVEKARGQVAALAGAEPGEVVFTSGATEAIAAVARQGWALAVASPVEHEAVHESLGLAEDSVVEALWPRGGSGGEASWPRDACEGDAWHRLADRATRAGTPPRVLLAATAACGETGIAGVADRLFERLGTRVASVAPGARTACLSDATQAIGRLGVGFSRSALGYAVASAHKLGGPKGVGALFVREGTELRPLLAGGGQEQSRRSGTENVVGIAGFGAAAEAARRELEDGVWERVAGLRDALEARLESAAPDLIIVGREGPRLPNTSCFVLPGWAGETQVMQMDLAGFAVSAGSACSSGKVERASRVLLALGLDEDTAASALRVSLGPTTTEAEVGAFAEAWTDCYRRRNSRAA
jgi:cysteine desulfurase